MSQPGEPGSAHLVRGGGAPTAPCAQLGAAAAARRQVHGSPGKVQTGAGRGKHLETGDFFTFTPQIEVNMVIKVLVAYPQFTVKYISYFIGALSTVVIQVLLCIQERPVLL